MFPKNGGYAVETVASPLYSLSVLLHSTPRVTYLAYRHLSSSQILSRASHFKCREKTHTFCQCRLVRFLHNISRDVGRYVLQLTVVIVQRLWEPTALGKFYAVTDYFKIKSSGPLIDDFWVLSHIGHDCCHMFNGEMRVYVNE